MDGVISGMCDQLLRLKNSRLKFKTSEKLATIVEESMEYAAS